MLRPSMSSASPWFNSNLGDLGALAVPFGYNGRSAIVCSAFASTFAQSQSMG